MTEEQARVPKLRFPGFADAWEQRKLGDLYKDAGSGGTPAVGDSSFYDGDIPFLSISDMRGRDTRFTAKTITQDGLNSSAAWLVPAGAIALAMYASVGKTAIIKRNMATSQAFFNMVFADDATKNFVFTRLERAEKEMEWESLISTGTQRNLNAGKVRDFAILVPSLSEQRRIGAFFASLDDLIALHQRKLSHLSLLKKGLLQKMFPKSGEAYPEIRFPGFADAWEQRKLGDLLEIRRGLTYTPVDVQENGVRVLRSSNIQNDKFVMHPNDVFVSEKSVNIAYAANNEILITSANGSSKLVGKHALIKGIPEGTAVAGGFMLVGHAQNPLFVNTHMNSNWYQRFIDTYVAGGNGAIGNLRANDLRNQPVLTPSEPEQHRIGAFFASLDDLIALHQRKLSHLQQQKKALLQQMFV